MRLASKRQKTKLFILQDGKCAICQKPNLLGKRGNRGP